MTSAVGRLTRQTLRQLYRSAVEAIGANHRVCRPELAARTALLETFANFSSARHIPCAVETTSGHFTHNEGRRWLSTRPSGDDDHSSTGSGGSAQSAAGSDEDVHAKRRRSQADGGATLANGDVANGVAVSGSSSGGSQEEGGMSHLPQGLTEEERAWLEGDDDDDEAAQEEMAQIYSAVEELVAQASELFGRGRPQDALALLKQGIAAAGEDLGEQDAPIVPIWEHLAMLQLLLGDLPSARESAESALRLALLNYEEQEPAVAVCKLRLGVLEAVSSNMAEAANLVGPAYQVLSREVGELYEGTGEAMYYQTLCKLWDARTAQQVEALTPAFERSVRIMADALQDGHPLLRLALMQHNRVISEALTPQPDHTTSAPAAAAGGGGGGRKEGGGTQQDRLLLALYRQEVGLHRALHPTDRHVALMLSHMGIVQYSRLDDPDGALESFKSAEAIVRHHLEGGGGSSADGGQSIEEGGEGEEDDDDEEEGQGDEGGAAAAAEVAAAGGGGGGPRKVLPEDEDMLQELRLRRGMVGALLGDTSSSPALLQQAREHFSQRDGGHAAILASEAAYGEARLRLAAAVASRGNAGHGGAGDGGGPGIKEEVAGDLEEMRRRFREVRKQLGERHMLALALERDMARVSTGLGGAAKRL